MFQAGPGCYAGRLFFLDMALAQAGVGSLK
jgi:hypothetical protein